ncbi:putative membrane protein [Halovivax ruber XH-70]|uniref:Putative membrane protein n=1 Tax=Halovivax ruber (strain DSM 18193 / JCM 13892 / XH-70) TaxID=797302 RepID=L0IFQ6_HALRX|nr:DUF418 domain-containing protein [Halovivax ruber]AGB17599.1 putative membrane protein [Halovivax ruber XH-70]
MSGERPTSSDTGSGADAADPTTAADPGPAADSGSAADPASADDAASAPTADRGPTPPSERIVGLDALRGFALLGILMVNIWVFAMPEAVLGNPTAYGDFSGANWWAWFVSDVFFRQKFLALFTFLFGASVVLFTRPDERGGRPTLELHYWRTGWLLVFGLAHAYLLWYGDILVAYAVCGFFVVLLRDLPAKTLAITGVLILAIPSATEVLAGLSIDPGATSTAWQPAKSVLEAEIDAYRGGWFEQFDHRLPTAIRRQTTGFLGYSAYRVSGSMLLGMALFKWGFLTNDRSIREYRRLIVGGGVAGLTVVLTGIVFIESADWSYRAGIFWRQFNYWGSFGLAGAYIGLVMLWSRFRPDGVVTQSLAAVGRTAFSNYIFQTVLATSIFYGHGLGLFASLSRVELLGVVLLIWAIQVPVSVLWLRYFRFGPLEWLWRTLTYREVQPMRATSE